MSHDNSLISDTERRKKKNGSARTVVVMMLDDSCAKFEAKLKDAGHALYIDVCNHIKLQETEFFGLQYEDSEKNICWLDLRKSMKKQISQMPKTKTGTGENQVLFRFRVLYFPPGPTYIREEYTRYLFTLQVRRSLLEKRLHCPIETAALLAACMVQGEFGDYNPTSHSEGYLTKYKFLPNQTPDVERKIAEYHSSLRGSNPPEVDYKMLDVASRYDTYGVNPYPAKDADGITLSLAATFQGILLFHAKEKINSFPWNKIAKIKYKRKAFIIIMKPFGKEKKGEVLDFYMHSRKAAEIFWKISCNNHAFFRKKSLEPQKAKVANLFNNDCVDRSIHCPRTFSDSQAGSSLLHNSQPSLSSFQYSAYSSSQSVATESECSYSLQDVDVSSLPPPAFDVDPVENNYLRAIHDLTLDFTVPTSPMQTSDFLERTSPQ